MALKPAIFIDKDNTLLVDVPYNVDPRRMRFMPGVAAGLKRLASLDMPLIVLSNQPGIALGKFDCHAMSAVRDALARMFLRAGAELGGFYYCPHHPQGVRPGYAMLCNCRKPAPGLLCIAAQRQALSLNASWFIGDILDDVEAGRRAGCGTVLLDNGGETKWRGGEWRTPDYIACDMDDASRWIVKRQAVLASYGQQPLDDIPSLAAMRETEAAVGLMHEAEA